MNIYASPNNVWIKKRTQAKYDIVYDQQTLIVNSWFLRSIYNQMLAEVFHKLDCHSILEVGSGRGSNILALAALDSEWQLTGLELSKNGYLNSLDLVKNPPPEIIGVTHKNINPERIKFIQGNALKIPFPDNSFDVVFTVLALEQMAYDYKEVLIEVKRVAKRYCVFIEPFSEANNLNGNLHLKKVDYFRYSYKNFEKLGFKILKFFTNYPQKVKSQSGLLVVQVVKNN